MGLLWPPSPDHMGTTHSHQGPKASLLPVYLVLIIGPKVNPRSRLSSESKSQGPSMHQEVVDSTRKCQWNGRWHINWGVTCIGLFPMPGRCHGFAPSLGLASWPWSHLLRHFTRVLSIKFCFYTFNGGPEEEGGKLTWLASKCPSLYLKSSMTTP